MKRFPFYLSQTQVDDLAQLLYTHQAIIDTISPVRPTPDRAFRFLTDMRQQCCDRSGAEDPFPDLPHVPGIFEDAEAERRRA